MNAEDRHVGLPPLRVTVVRAEPGLTCGADGCRDAAVVTFRFAGGGVEPHRCGSHDAPMRDKLRGNGHLVVDRVTTSP